MKKLKNILLIFIAIFSITLICSCEKNDDKQNTNDKEENEKTNQVKIYEFAKSNGYTGSYKDWVNSITNNGIELIVESNSIKWKYKNEGNWINLVSLLDLIESKDEKIVFSSNSTHILYRYASDITWNNLLALEDLGFNYSTNITNAGQTAYDIAVELGFVGTVEDWILSLRSDNVLSAYEIYKKYYPEYEGTEEDWINELASGSLISNENKTTVTFKDGDTVIKTEEYSYGELINTPEELEKDNYKFLGWTYEGYDWNFDLFYVGKGIELQAKWAKVHTISFTTGTTQVIKDIKVIDGESFKIPDIEYNKGYSFLGWSYDSQYFDIGKSYVASSDMNIVANWAKVSNVAGSTYGKAPDDIVYDELDNDRLDVYVSYNGESGITWRDTQAFVNPVDGKTYNRGDLLPTWRAFAEKTKTKIYEACNYMATSNDGIWTQVINNNMMSEVDNSQAIDLLYTTTTNLKSGKFVNLLADDGTGKKYIDYMPNFKKWWNENKAIHNEVLYNGGLYYTPYAEGYNETEKTFNMDTDMVQKVLDCSNFDLFDTTINGGLMADSNVLQSGKYTPFINADYNYPDEKTKVTILVDNKAKDIYINRTTNIIKQQNELLANGCTGKQLAEQFAAYIDTAFKDLIGVNKIYETRSEIFISEKAAYNADELIALMRVIKANPGVITGDIHKEIEILFPRGEAANRVESIQSFA